MTQKKISNKIKLLDGEKLEQKELLENNIPKYRNFSDKEINEKYDKGETRIVTEQARYPLHTITSMVSSEKYILNPEYQRRHRWSTEKKSRLIESLIINVPIPPIFLYEVDLSVFEVMDGLQRLTAISQFYKDKFSLDGLSEWPELNGKKYSELPERVRKGIDRRYLSSIILLQETSSENKKKEKFLKQLVFERLNSGGEKLSDQETRNALYNGPFNQACIKLARNKYFCRLWHIPEPNNQEENEQEEKNDEFSNGLLENDLFKKMQDVELVLRFFAYRQIDLLTNKFIVKGYLDEYLIKANKFSTDTISLMSELFKETCELLYTIFGAEALFIKREKSWKSPSITMYDPIMYAFSKYVKQGEDLKKNKKNINQSLLKVYKIHSGDFEGRKSSRNDTIQRINLIDEVIQEFVKK